MRLIDAHCHLQDQRVAHVWPQFIQTATDSGIHHLAVNGVSQKDWHLVKQMAEQYPPIIPCFGLHPWFVAERSADWLKVLRKFFEDTPSACVGEIGLHKDSHVTVQDFASQIEVFRRQLELAKELERPASIHCVQAFGELLEIMESIGPFPAGVMLHSYIGSAELVPRLVKLGTYFSFSGHNTAGQQEKLKKVLKSTPVDKILLESDAPDALPKVNLSELRQVPGFPSDPQELSEGGSTMQMETLNQPANIHIVLNYIASLLEIPAEELAETSYQNTIRFFSYPDSKICGQLS